MQKHTAKNTNGCIVFVFLARPPEQKLSRLALSFKYSFVLLQSTVFRPCAAIFDLLSVLDNIRRVNNRCRIPIQQFEKVGRQAA